MKKNSGITKIQFQGKMTPPAVRVRKRNATMRRNFVRENMEQIK